MDTNGVLLQRPEGYQLQILRGEKSVTIPISLTGDLRLRGINDGEEAVILESHGFRHAYYPGEADRQLHRSLMTRTWQTVGFDDHFHAGHQYFQDPASHGRFERPRQRRCG